MTESADDNVVLKVEGMTCSHCVGRVRRALNETPGVTEARVDLDSGTAEVRLGAGAGVASLIAAVKKAGYEAHAA